MPMDTVDLTWIFEKNSDTPYKKMTNEQLIMAALFEIMQTMSVSRDRRQIMDELGRRAEERGAEDTDEQEQKED